MRQVSSNLKCSNLSVTAGPRRCYLQGTGGNIDIVRAGGGLVLFPSLILLPPFDDTTTPPFAVLLIM